MPAAPVTLIIGNHPIAGAVAHKARERGDQTLVAIPHASSSIEHIPLTVHDYNTYVSAFHTALRRYPGIDNVILIFCPTTVTRPAGHIPGSDPSGLDEVVHPLMMAVKNVWYHWKRDDRYAREKDLRKLTILAAEGHDAETRAAANATLGFWRSILVRTQIIGPSTDLVVSDLEDSANKDATIAALLAAPSVEPSVHIVSKGRTTVQSSTVGQCSSLSIESLGARLIPLIWLKVKADKLAIRLNGLLSPPKSAPLVTRLNGTALRSLPIALFTYLAMTSYYAQRPVSAFIFGLIAARLSAVAGTALLGVTAAHVFFGRKITF